MLLDCLDVLSDLKEEERVSRQKLLGSSISNIITSSRSNRSRSLCKETLRHEKRTLRDPTGGTKWEGAGRGLRGFWHETTPLKDLSHACQLEIRGLSCKCRSAINETLQPCFVGEYRFSLMASWPSSLQLFVLGSIS